MLIHPTLDQLHSLGLQGMAKAFNELADNDEAAGLGHADWLALLLEREAVHRQDKRLGARLRHARLRHHAVPEDIDYRAHRGIDRGLLASLVKGDWIDACDNLMITGPTGVGKSWLACALGHKACRDNRAVLYVRVPKLFDELALAHGDGSVGRRLKTLGAAQLLILDDWGLEPLGAQARHDLLEILEDRYGRRSTIAHPARVHRDDPFVEAREASLVLGDQLRIEAARTITRDLQSDPAGLGQHRLLAKAVAPVGRPLSRLHLKMVVHLGVQRLGDPDVEYPRYIAGQRAAPPEDRVASRAFTTPSISWLTPSILTMPTSPTGSTATIPTPSTSRSSRSPSAASPAAETRPRRRSHGKPGPELRPAWRADDAYFGNADIADKYPRAIPPPEKTKANLQAHDHFRTGFSRGFGSPEYRPFSLRVAPARSVSPSARVQFARASTNHRRRRSE